MSNRLRILLAIVVIIYDIVAVRMIHRKRLNLTYSLLWLLMSVLLLVAVIFPDTIYTLSNYVGIDVPLNMVFTLFAFFALLMLFYLTCIVSRDNEKSRALTQQIALLEKRIRDLESKRKGA